MIPDPGPAPEARCVACGNPMVDHAHPCYSIKVWIAHKVLRFLDWVSGVRP